MRRRLPEARWLLLAGLGALLPPAVVLASGHSLVWRDTAQLNAALRPAIVEALRALRVPGWNPWEGTGQPLFTQMLHGVLHPVSVAVAAFTTSTDALIVALILFAAVGAWLAVRELGGSPVAACGAALAFALSGFLLSMCDNTSYLIPTATGPWVVGGLVAAATRPAGWIAAALAVAAVALAGDPGSLFAFALVGYGLAFGERRWRGLLVAGAASALGFALAAIQYVPSWLYMADTARGAGGLNPGDLHRWALAPWRLLELVAPGFFVGLPRSYDAPVFAALDGATRDRFPFTPSVFVGAVTLLLAAVAARSSRRARWLVGFALLFAWIALGHRAGSQALLARVPFWGSLRYWEKMVGPVTLCVALAAGLGIDALVAGAGKDRSPLRAAAAGAALALAGILVLFLPGVAAGFAADAGVAALAARHLQVGLVNAAVGLALLAAAVALGGTRPRWVGAAAVAAVFVQSAAAAPFALHPGDRSALAVRPPALAAAPPGPRLVAPLGCDFRDGQGQLDAIDLLNVCERRTGRPTTNAESRTDTLATYSSLAPMRWEMIIGSGPLFWPLARRFGTTHVVGRPPQNRAEGGALEAATAGATGFQALDGGRLLVWEIPHRPWASFAPAVRVAPDRAVAGALLADELERRGEAVVVETRGEVPRISSGRVLSVRRGVEELEITAESDGDALLVVNDAWGPGWEASIDGAAAELMPADVLVRAVRWPAGRHTLRMQHRVPGLALGALVSACAAALAAALLAWQRRRGAPREATP